MLCQAMKSKTRKKTTGHPAKDVYRMCDLKESSLQASDQNTHTHTQLNKAREEKSFFVI